MWFEALLPLFSYDSAFWLCAGGLTTVLMVTLVAWGLHRFTLVTVVWTLTAWFGGMGILVEALGAWYETILPQADGLLMLVVGAAFLALAGVVATFAAKLQLERKLDGMFPKSA